MSLLSTYPPTRLNAGAMPLTGVMVEPFPEPGRRIRIAMQRLQYASLHPPESEDEVRARGSIPRPWDPGSCTGALRAELWEWLDRAAIWINEQHLWNVAQPGIPECWPAHPHLVHDLAVITCGRYYTRFSVTPAALEDWHRYSLPTFLERLDSWLGEGCPPGKHEARPRKERDERHAEDSNRRARTKRYAADVKGSATLPVA